ncbi:MAG: hypothetical protein Kow00105_07280 [Phycisphaeraceae bacterium]
MAHRPIRMPVWGLAIECFILWACWGASRPVIPEVSGLFVKVAAAQDQVVDVEQPTAEVEVPSDATSQDADELATLTPTVGWLSLSESLREGPIPYAWITPEEAGPSLEDVLTQLDHVADHENYLGIVIHLDHPALRLSQVLTLADRIEQVRQAGKRVLVYAEAYDMMDYLLASSADMILLQHKGEVRLHGLAVEEMYLAGLLDKIGAKADLIQIGKYKGADESWTRHEPSEAWNENFDALLDDLYGQIIKRIADNRGVPVEEVEQWLADSWTMQDTDFLLRRVVDRLTDRDLIEVTEVEFGDNFLWDDSMGFGGGGMTINNPMMLFGMLFKEPDTRTHRPTIAVVHATGPIHSGESSRGSGLFDVETIGSKTMLEVLGDVRDDENIKGAVIRIDSPGGSALASEIIWQAVRELGEQKPVYVSVGSMAASGGYYIACAGDRVYVNPCSIVGSIGVVGGKIVLGGLYDWAGIGVYRRSRGPMSDLFNSVEPFTETQRETIRASMQLIYDQFLDRVRLGRGTRLSDINRVAEGRLFTGRQAVENGLADHLGNIARAMNDLADELGLDEGEYDVLHLPPPMSLQTFINDLFGVQAPQARASSSSSIETVKQLLGPRAWRSVSATVQGLLLLQREPVLTLMPNALIIR